MNIVYSTRVFLIRFAKVFPFILCAIILASYVESVCALLTSSYYEHNGDTILYKPISWYLGEWFVYDWRTIAVVTTFSLAFETCWYNKACAIYACINAWERDYFLTIELEPTTIYLICLANIIVAGYLTTKGIIILLK